MNNHLIATLRTTLNTLIRYEDYLLALKDQNTLDDYLGYLPSYSATDIQHLRSEILTHTEIVLQLLRQS